MAMANTCSFKCHETCTFTFHCPLSVHVHGVLFLLFQCYGGKRSDTGGSRRETHHCTHKRIRQLTWLVYNHHALRYHSDHKDLMMHFLS